MINDINKQLVENPEHIKNILEKFDFCHVNIGRKEVRCGIDEDSKSGAIRIKLNEHLSTCDFKSTTYGNLISFIMKTRNLGFSDVISVVNNELGVDWHNYYHKKSSIFGGFYDKIKRYRTDTYELKVYDKSILDNYIFRPNLKFLNDGISIETQIKFKIGIDVVSQRAICIWYDFVGNIVGITGRYLGDYEEDEIYKWMPVIPHPKSQTLYGYIENYVQLQDCDEIYVGESEKFPLQLDTMSINTCVSLGGNTIHAEQIRHLIWCNPQKIIFCFDEGLDIKVIMKAVNAVKAMARFKDIKIGAIIDKNNVILPKDSKCSPSDLGKEKFLELKNNYTEWMN